MASRYQDASALAFTVGDAETAVSSLVVTAVSSDQDLVPDGNLVVGGADAARTITATPVGDSSGVATVTVTVDDGVVELDAVVAHCGIDKVGKGVIAYEPVWAIGTGKTATPQQAQKPCVSCQPRMALPVAASSASRGVSHVMTRRSSLNA